MTVVKAEGLTKSYVQGSSSMHVLDGVDLELDRGELAAVLGPSGTGKTTLLNLLGLLDRPTSGRLELFGVRADSLSDDARAGMRNQRIGFVFQFDSLLPEFTVLENVMMPALIRAGARIEVRREAAVRGLEILRRFGLESLQERFPQALSGGEKQRIAMARALMNAPELLLADEPTGNLDHRNASLVFEDLRRVSAEMGVAVLLVTHNEAATHYASRTYHLVDGKLDPGHGPAKIQAAG